MELEEGKIYTNEELAQWFGITKKSFTNSRKAKLAWMAENNADIEILYGKVKVLRVWDPVYTNPRNKEANNIKYQKAIVRIIAGAPLQLFITCAGRVVQLGDQDIKKLNHEMSTSYNYVRENLPKVATSSSKIWCHRFYYEAIDFIPLNEDQLAAWKQIIGNSYDDMVLAELESQFENGDITKEEYEQHSKEARHGYWERAKKQFKQIYGFEPVCVRQWELNAFALKELGIDIKDLYKEAA